MNNEQNLKILNHIINGGVYYTWYRFDSQSNYITFEQWCLNYVNKMSIDDKSKFIKRNKIKGS